MKFISLFIVGFLCITSCLLANQNETSLPSIPPNTLRLVVEKDELDHFKIFNFNSKGIKEPLTLSSFFRATAELILGNKIENCSKGTPLKIFYEKNEQGIIVTHMIDANGVKKRFLFKDLILALPGTLKCQEKKAVNTPFDVQIDHLVQIYLDKDASNILQTYIIHPDGRKEILDFANLLTASAEMLNDCPLGTEKNRALYLVFEKNAEVYPKTTSTSKYPTDVLQTLQIDAYGLKEEFNLDNLVNAAAETLQVCKKDKTKALTPVPSSPALQIKFEKDINQNLLAYLIDSKGKRNELTLATLITAAAGISPCKLAPKVHYINVVIQKDDKNNLKPYVIDAKGNKRDFNLLGNLMTTALTLCANKVETVVAEIRECCDLSSSTSMD